MQLVLPIELRTPPLAISPMEQGMPWHGYRTQDPALAWLRGSMMRAGLNMDAATA